MRNARKVALVGLDSITPSIIRPMLEQGAMPSLAELAAQGWSSDVIPTMPPTTPTGWTTVATGAWPSTHGIEGFAVRREGEPLDRRVHSLTSDMVRAEQVWKVAGRHGLESVLLKFPVSWPPTETAHLVQVDGAAGWGGLKCPHDLLHSGCWDSAAHASYVAGGTSQWMTRDADNLDEEHVRPISFDSATPRWTNLPLGFCPSFGATVPLDSRHGGRVDVHLLAGELDGAPRLLVAPKRDATGIRTIACGEWSDHLELRFDSSGGSGFLRLKVMQLELEPPSLRIYQAQLHRRDGYTRPAALAAELEAVAGPFVEWSEAYDLLQGWIDDRTQYEIYRDHVDWMIRATRHLLRTRPWGLFMTQLHVLDMAYHVYWGALDARHPGYRSSLRDSYWSLLRDIHRLADELVAAVVAEADEDTLVVVLGDHGHCLYHTALLVNHLLVRHGLLALRRDPRTGSPRVDWRRTAAFAAGYRVYVNLSGRDPDGAIPRRDYDSVRDRIISALRGAGDPRTGEMPVRVAVRHEDAARAGLHGAGKADVIFAMSPGYQARGTIAPPPESWSEGRLDPDRLAILQATQLFREFSGEHDTSFPGNAGVETLLYLRGRGIRAAHSTAPVRLVDVAPTICHWLGLPAPADCQGRALREAFEA